MFLVHFYDIFPTKTLRKINEVKLKYKQGKKPRIIVFVLSSDYLLFFWSIFCKIVLLLFSFIYIRLLLPGTMQDNPPRIGIGTVTFAVVSFFCTILPV